MIPAVLSCVFVLYLYRTLNALAPDDSVIGKSGTLDDIAAVEVRLVELRKRIDRLPESADGEVRQRAGF